MSKIPTFIAIPGYSVKPSQVLGSGRVMFTDGTTNIISPNQAQCEAYGYTYDKGTGICKAFTSNYQIQRSVQKFNNNIQGGGNTIEAGTLNTYIMGEENTVKGMSRNNIIGGSKNEVQNSINNAAVFGINGDATRQSEFAIGGGDNKITTGSDTAYADRQVSIVNLSCTTTDNSTTNMTVNNLGGFINVKNNCILGYELYITRLETGGTSGTAGNFSYRNQKGVVRINNAYSMTITVGFDRNIGKLGVNGTFAVADTSTSDVKSISIQVSDRNNVNNIWSATVYLHELVSTSVTF
tara:strand:- start:916 stop:1800 length:885 start_codon:yes stop_codon:yes gene_type:complete